MVRYDDSEYFDLPKRYCCVLTYIHVYTGGQISFQTFVQESIGSNLYFHIRPSRSSYMLAQVDTKGLVKD